MFLPAVGCEEAAGLRPHSFQNQVLLWVMLNTCRVPDTTLSTSKYLHKVEFLIPSREAEPLGCVCVCFYVCVLYRGLPGGTAGKESAYNAGDPGSIPELGRSPGERHSY